MRLSPLFCILLASWGGTMAAACADRDTTHGKHIVLRTRITAGREANEPFTNARGWTIVLSKIVVSTGALYYLEGAPVTAWRGLPNPQRTRVRDHVELLFGLKTAWAHPGHYLGGEARGQVLSPTSVDLHGEGATLPLGEGVTGLVRSATFSYHAPPSGPMAEALSGHVAILEGAATKGTDQRLFRAEIDADDIASSSDGTPTIDGCPFEETTFDDDATVLVTVRPAVWFSQVEFDTLPATTASAVQPMPASLARNQLVRGMKAGAAYTFSVARR